MKRLLLLGLVTSLAILAGTGPAARSESRRRRVRGSLPAVRVTASSLPPAAQAELDPAPPGQEQRPTAPGPSRSGSRPHPLVLTPGRCPASRATCSVGRATVDKTEARIVARSGEAVGDLRRPPTGPSRPSNAFIVQHTHTDIGSTDLPSTLSVDHRLHREDSATATTGLPFRTTRSSAGPASDLARREAPAPAPRSLIDRFLARVKERIEVTGIEHEHDQPRHEEGMIRSLYRSPA